MRLTRPNIAHLALPPGKSELLVFDDALPGFGIRLRAGGKRVWIVQYRIGAKQRRVTLGSVNTVDPDEAHKLAKATLAKAHLGNDPQAEKAEARAKASVTFGAVAERYLRHMQDRLRPRSYQEVERHLLRHWAPLKGVPIHRVQRAAVATRLGEIAQEKGRFASNRARASLSALFTWAIGEGLVETVPVIGTNKAAEEISRDHVVTDAELRAIWNACRNDDHGRIVRLLMLTAQRREEIGALNRRELDLEHRLWVLPRDRTKNGLEHQVPLSGPAIEILQEALSRSNREFVFGEGVGAFQGWSKAKAALDKRIAQSGAKVRPWRLHDLRRTAATAMAELGVLPHVLEAVLNHVSGHKDGVAGIYNRATYFREKRQALEVWADHVIALIPEAKLVRQPISDATMSDENRNYECR